jgi:hypothetical protein
VFRAAHSKYIDSKSALIDGEPKVLLFDGVPILFTGKNEYQQDVIGTSIRDHDDLNLERYFHIVVTPKDFRLFHAGLVNYLELLRRAEPIFVVEKSISSEKTRVGVTKFSEIPNEVLPTEYSFFPKELHEPTIEYSTKIAGGSADEHLAFPEDVSTIQNQITDFLSKSLHAIKERMGFVMETKLSPSTVSSYGINYVIKLTNYPAIIAPEDKLLAFVNSFTEFCMDHLPEEIDQVMDLNSAEVATHFNQLFDKALELAPIYEVNDEAFEKAKNKLKDALRKDVLAVPPILKPVAEIISKNYGSLRLDNNNLPLGTIDKTFNENLDAVMAKLDEITVDDRAKSFHIIVYLFNKKSGVGKAEVIIEDQRFQVGFHIISYEQEESASYIESMAGDRLIPVQGLMTYKGKKPHHLDIYV